MSSPCTSRAPHTSLSFNMQYRIYHIYVMVNAGGTEAANGRAHTAGANLFILYLQWRLTASDLAAVH